MKQLVEKTIQSVFFALVIASGNIQAQEISSNSVYNLSLEELGNVRVSSGGSLTSVSTDRTPASVTSISRQMIRESGARNLDELLDIFTPNFMRMRQAASGPDIGMRGILSSRDNKTLLLVNGKVMNHRMLFGAITERFLPMLGDIESIEVIRGPGSSVFGPGAISGVISIRTDAEDYYTGSELLFRKGFTEDYVMGEFRFGHTFNNQLNLSGYIALDDYEGADAEDSALVFSRTTDYFTAGVPIKNGIEADNRAMHGRPHIKAYMQLKNEQSLLWARFTRGSLHYLPARSTIENVNGFERVNNSLLYEHFTVQAEHNFTITPTLGLDVRASFDINESIRDFKHFNTSTYEYHTALKEEETAIRALLSWAPTTNQTLAFGLEHAREEFGGDPDNLTGDPAHIGNGVYESWETKTDSVLAEYQLNPNEDWTLLLGGRADRHTYTDWMYSPRAALIYSWDDRNISKLLFNRSVRKADDKELRDQALRNPDITGDIESIDSFELVHEYKGDNYSVMATAFTYTLDSLGWIQSIRRVAPLGESEVLGLELESTFNFNNHQISISYAHTKLQDFKLINPAIRNQLETSQPYGYGDDLHHWPLHIAKINWRWRLSDHLKAFSSLRAYWDFQGAEDYADYNNEVLMQSSISLSDGSTDAFDPRILLNMGILYEREKFNFDVQLHNSLGWIDEDYNKQGFYARQAGYRNEAPAVSIGFSYAFR